LAIEIVGEIENLLGRQAVEDLDLEALELAVRQQALRLAGRAVEQRLSADTSDQTGQRIRCRCGGQARFAGRRTKQFQSVLGPLRLQRAYYHCSACGRGFCPRDRHLGIENTSLSPALTRMTGTVGAMVSFQEGSELLKELAGVTVDAKQVERTAEALGGFVNLICGLFREFGAADAPLATGTLFSTCIHKCLLFLARSFW